LSKLCGHSAGGVTAALPVILDAVAGVPRRRQARHGCRPAARSVDRPHAEVPALWP